MEQIRIGVIGAGGRGELARFWHHPEGKSVVVAGADISDRGLDEFKKKVNPDAYLTKDYHELLDDLAGCRQHHDGSLQSSIRSAEICRK